MRKTAFFILLILLTSSVSAAHFIIGYVNDALDTTPADGHTVLLWNPSNGLSDNLTDIIGPLGNSGTNNYFMIDCELLNTPCNLNDQINVKIINNGDDYVSYIYSTTVTGAGFDSTPDLSINTPPNTTLNYPTPQSNISATQFNCSFSDLDDNLANITLYGSWGSGWHANETKSITGPTGSTTFNKILTEGKYIWNCLTKDNLSVSKFASENYSFTLDYTPPTITSIIANVTNLCGQQYARINCTTADLLTNISLVLIQSTSPTYIKNYTAQILSGNTYYSDILINESGNWNFTCISFDYANNSATSSKINLTQISNTPQIKIDSSDLKLNKLNPVENEQIILNATFQNPTCAAINNFYVAFYEKNENNPKIQIGNNVSISIPAFLNTSISIGWNTKIGKTNLSVFGDFNNSIVESNETDNEATIIIFLTSWENLYGNVSLDSSLTGPQTKTLKNWSFSNQKVVFVADKESNIHWANLQALSINSSNGQSPTDFSTIDQSLNMSNLNDSISNVFTSDGITPLKTDSFTVRDRIIQNTPVINSSTPYPFVTGILWDTTKDTNGKYDLIDNEDIIFVTKTIKSTQGAYGTYDYEIKIPAKLRELRGPDLSEVYIYSEIP